MYGHIIIGHTSGKRHNAQCALCIGRRYAHFVHFVYKVYIVFVYKVFVFVYKVFVFVYKVYMVYKVRIGRPSAAPPPQGAGFEPPFYACAGSLLRNSRNSRNRRNSRNMAQ